MGTAPTPLITTGTVRATSPCGGPATGRGTFSRVRMGLGSSGTGAYRATFPFRANRWGRVDAAPRPNRCRLLLPIEYRSVGGANPCRMHHLLLKWVFPGLFLVDLDSQARRL